MDNVLDLSQKQDMAPWERRLIHERNELSDRLEALVSFLDSEEKGALSAEMLACMFDQVEAMGMYLAALECRLELLGLE